MTKQHGGVFFDLDGTLIDTAPDMGAALNALLAEEDRPPLTLETMRPIVSHGSKALVKMGFGANLDADSEATLIKRFLRCYGQCVADNSALFAGMDELLLKLEAAGTPWGIVTNKPLQFAIPLMEQLRLKDRCASLVCSNSMAKRKPDPDPIYLACQRTASKPESSLYVGDAERDIEAGNAAGMTTVVVNWGYFGADENTTDWGADVHCEDAAALWKVCEGAGLAG